VGKAQQTRLRWKSYNEPAKRAADSSTSETTADTASQTKPTPKRTTRSRLEEHARREAAHIAQTSGTKPKNDPFDDPFFTEGEPTPRMAARAKPDSVLSQPVRLKQQQLDLNEPLPEPEDPLLPEVDSDFGPLQPTPDDGVMSNPELPEPEPGMEEEEEDQRNTFLTQGYEPGQLPPCPSPTDVKQIREITTDISAQAGEFPPECPLGDVAYSPRMFMPITYTWKASALCYKPLYFQQAALERYGHSWGPLLQPFISGADFYARVFALPYMMGMDPPCQCVYALGWYRPGSCAPQAIYPIPISVRGALLEAGVVIGAAAVIP
jgi:hypothetical protein